MRRFLSAVIAGVLAFAGRSTPPAGQERRRSAKAGPDFSAGQRERRDPVQEVEEGTVFTLLVPDSVMEASYLSSGIISYRLALTRGPNGLSVLLCTRSARLIVPTGRGRPKPVSLERLAARVVR